MTALHHQQEPSSQRESQGEEIHELTGPVTPSAILRNFAKRLRKEGNLAQALSYISNAIELDEKANDRNGMAADYEFLGGLHLASGHLDRAEECLRRVLELHPDSQIDPLVSTALGNLGLIYRRRGELSAARRLMFKSLQIARKLRRPDLVSVQYANLGILCASVGQRTRARILMENASGIFRALRMQDALGTAESVLRYLDATV